MTKLQKKEAPEESQDTLDEVIAAIDAAEVDPDRHLSIQLDKSLREAIQASQASNQPASVTLTVKLKSEAGRRVTFTANVNAKLPRPPVSGVTLFADANGAVHNSDPAQLRMDLQAFNPTPNEDNEED